VALNGEPVRPAPDGNGYVTVEREWREGDDLTVTFPMPIRQLVADPAVEATRNRVALRRGPIVYCVEAVDVDRPPHELRLPADAGLEATHEPDLLDGVTVLEGEALAPVAGSREGPLYRRREEEATERVPFRAVPYYAWDHREPGEMRVWLHRA
jgi:hypothetical protein